MDSREIQKAVATTKKWIDSQDGRASLGDALRRARETTNQLKAERRVEPKTLHESFTL